MAARGGAQSGAEVRDGGDDAAVVRDDDGDDDDRRRAVAVVAHGDDDDGGAAAAVVAARDGVHDGVHGVPNAGPGGCRTGLSRDVAATL